MRVVPRLRARALAGALLVLWFLLLAGHPLLHRQGARYSLRTAACYAASSGHPHAESVADAECAVCLIQHLPQQVVLPFHPTPVLAEASLPAAAAPSPRRSQPPRRLARAPPFPMPRSSC